MKGRDSKIFWLIVVFSTIGGYWVFSVKFNMYSDLITFLSIMIGFKITSLSMLFSSPLKKMLYDKDKIKNYGTELHRLKDFYKHSIMFEIISVFLLFIIPEFVCSFSIRSQTIIIGRYLLILPILTGVMFCFFKLYSDLLKIFTYPTNN